MTLIQAARRELDTKRRERLFGEAAEALQKFVREHANHELFFYSAQLQLANLHVERARMIVAKSKRKMVTGDERTELLIKARTEYEQARKTLSELRELLKENLSAIRRNLDPADPGDRKIIRIRDRFRTDYLQARLLEPAVIEEMADAHPNGSMRRHQLLMDAAKMYQGVFEDFRRRIAGLYARMYQGRCYAKIGKFDEALLCYDDLLANPKEPDAFLQLKKKILTLAVDCWMAEGRNQHTKAIHKITDVLTSLNELQQREPEWLYLRFSLAKAWKARFDDLTEKKNTTAETTAKAKRALEEARKHIDFVSRHPSEYRLEAKRLRISISDEKPEKDDLKPKTSDEARRLGKQVLDDVQTGCQ